MANVKIRVVKKITNKDLIEEYGNNVKPQCEMFKVGDEFIVKNGQIPVGFCSWAWPDIQRDVVVLANDGNFSSSKERGTTIACCTDGYRPVVFRLERIKE
jgi:uncharacterized repeat protein (TIGR04076 family)